MDDQAAHLSGASAPAGGEPSALAPAADTAVRPEPARFGATPTLQTRPEWRRLFALVMIPLALATALAPLGSGGEPVCGVAVEIQDPGVRASFARFDRQQSAGAAEICAHYRDERPVL